MPSILFRGSQLEAVPIIRQNPQTEPFLSPRTYEKSFALFCRGFRLNRIGEVDQNRDHSETCIGGYRGRLPSPDLVKQPIRSVYDGPKLLNQCMDDLASS